MKRLLTIQETFDIKSWGALVVVPGPLADEYTGAGMLEVQLRKPDGTTSHATLTIQWISQTPPPKERRWGCLFHGLSKSEVPVGTEVWYEDA